MAYDLEKMTHNQLVKKMEEETLKKTGIPFKFEFELASDGNLDLYRVDEHVFTVEEINKMVEMDWFVPSFAEEVKERLEEGEKVEEIDPFEYHENTLAQSHMLFQFVLEKTFGEGAKIAGVEDLDDCVLLNVASPVK